MLEEKVELYVYFYMHDPGDGCFIHCQHLAVSSFLLVPLFRPSFILIRRSDRLGSSRLV